jgi:outer membrane protein assembly factor BamB
VVVAIAVTVALVVPGGGRGSGSSRGSGVASGHSAAVTQKAWQADQPQYDAMASVTYANELAVSADTGVYAYDQATGKLLWVVKPPPFGSNAGAFCGSAQTAVDGMLSVGIGDVTDPEHHVLDCRSVGLVNLKTGKLAWTQQIPTAAQLKANVISTEGIVTEISGNTVLATWNNIGVAYSASSGRRIWSQSFDAEFRDLAVSAGTFYALFQQEVPVAGEPPMALDGINPATGDVTSRLHMTAQMTHTGPPATGAIVSTSPMTLLVSDDGDDSNASYLVLDATKQHITTVIPAGPQFPGAGHPVLNAMTVGGNTDSHPYVKAIVGGGMLIAVSYPDATQSADQLIGYDLATGAQRWSASRPDIKMIAPIAVDGSTVIAAGDTNAGAGNATLVRVDLASGKILSSTPRPTGQDAVESFIDDYHFTWSDGRAYAVDWEQAPDVADIPGLFTMSGAA